jgi:hypothetical protein
VFGQEGNLCNAESSHETDDGQTVSWGLDAGMGSSVERIPVIDEVFGDRSLDWQRAACGPWLVHVEACWGLGSYYAYSRLIKSMVSPKAWIA